MRFRLSPALLAGVASAALTASFAGCAAPSASSATQSPQPTGTPAATPSASPSPVVSATAVASPQQPEATSSPAPMATSAAAQERQRVPRVAPMAPPGIISLAIAPGTVLSAGEMASGTVVTTSNVAAVQIRVANIGMNMQKTGVGRFEMSYRVPWLPAPWRGSYTLHVIASTTSGQTAERDVGITLH